MKEIKAAMKAQGITKYRLAKLTGLNRSTIGRVLSGKQKAKPETMELIKNALGL